MAPPGRAECSTEAPCFTGTPLRGPRLDTLQGGSLGSTRDHEEEEMPKYRFQASYTVQGEEGVRSKGGTDRRDAVADTVHSVGGEVECLYFEFGEHDAFSIVDLPDDEAAAAVSLIAKLRRRSDGEDDRAAHTRTGRRGGEPRGHLPSAGALSTPRRLTRAAARDQGRGASLIKPDAPGSRPRPGSLRIAVVAMGISTLHGRAERRLPFPASGVQAAAGRLDGRGTGASRAASAGRPRQDGDDRENHRPTPRRHGE